MRAITLAACAALTAAHGMLLLPTGHRDTLRFVPPLVVTEAEVDECLHKVQDAVQEITSRAGQQAQAFG